MSTPPLAEIAEFYRKRFGFGEPDRSITIHPDTKVIIVIPCYNEPNLLTTLHALQNCNTPKYPVAVLIVINAGKEAEQKVLGQNMKSEKEATQWIKDHTSENLFFHVIRADNLPPRHAGVGLARKIGMDEALYQFAKIGFDGLIVCLDADCTVENNYLQVLENYCIEKNPKTITLYFEHDLERVGDEQLKEGIIRYELFLRYYVNALRYSGFPFAFHTIGSSMGVRAAVYAKSGGMNRRKAGEDFYFLHKVAPQGDLLEVNDTTVYPSARISDRVPFGTGKAQSEWKRKSNTIYFTYNHLIFKDLKYFISSIDKIYNRNDQKVNSQWLQTLPEAVRAFLAQENFEEKSLEIQKNTRNVAAFQKRFYAWLDGFKVLKFVHFARDHFYPQVPIEEASRQLLQWQHHEDASGNAEDLLMRYRKLDKSSNIFIKK